MINKKVDSNEWIRVLHSVFLFCLLTAPFISGLFSGHHARSPLWFPESVWVLPWWLSAQEYTCKAGDEVLPPVGTIPWRRAWQPTPVLLLGEFHGRRSLVGCSPWGGRKSDTPAAARLVLDT